MSAACVVRATVIVGGLLRVLCDRGSACTLLLSSDLSLMGSVATQPCNLPKHLGDGAGWGLAGLPSVSFSVKPCTANVSRLAGLVRIIAAGSPSVVAADLSVCIQQ